MNRSFATGVKRCQMECPPAIEACAGSPDSAVAVVVLTDGRLPLAAEITVAAEKLSLAGAAASKGAKAADSSVVQRETFMSCEYGADPAGTQDSAT